MAEEPSDLHSETVEHIDSIVDDDCKSYNESEKHEYDCLEDVLSINEEEHDEENEEYVNNLYENVSRTVEIFGNDFADEQTVTSSKETENLKKLSTNYSKSNSKDVNAVSLSVIKNDYEEDKHFALSLVGYFQRMSIQKKAKAKLKILTILTDLELSSD